MRTDKFLALVLCGALTLAGSLAGGCDPFAFDDLSDEAPTRVLEVPDGYPQRGYGRVVQGFEGELNGQPTSRIAATGGTDSPVIVYRAWAEDDFVGTSLHELCDDAGDCDEGAGAAVAGVPVWRAGSPDEGRMCVLVTAPTSGHFLVRCESGGGATGFERFTGPAGQRFGASAASLGEGNPVGVAVVGAPDAPSGAGTGLLYRVPDASGATEIELHPDIEATVRLAGGRLGESIAATRMADGRTLVAAGAPGVGRVVILVLSDTADAEVRGCLDDRADGYGESLAWGDVNGDGAPELFVGSGSETEGRLTVVHQFDGASLPDAADTCTGSDWGTPTEIPCPDGLRDGSVGCGFSGFGGALAVGDVDADGFGDLLVGAPFAEVDGAKAGAVFVIPGSDGGLDTPRADALTHSSPEEGDELGFSLTTVGTHLGPDRRDEPVAGAPGRDSVLVFLCSGLTGDTPEIGERCIAN